VRSNSHANLAFKSDGGAAYILRPAQPLIARRSPFEYEMKHPRSGIYDIC